MADKQQLEKRLAALELKIEAMEARRAKLVPPEIDADENIMALMQDRMKNAVDTWKQVLAVDGHHVKEARIRDMQAQALRELEAQGKSDRQRQEAELLAVIQYFEKFGSLPENCGYVIEDPDFQPINSKVF